MAYAEDCKSFYIGSIPVPASKILLLFRLSSAVEQSAVNRSVICSNQIVGANLSKKDRYQRSFFCVLRQKNLSFNKFVLQSDLRRGFTMDNNKTYGYHQLDEESYRNIMNAPNIGVSIPRTGYNFQATNFICSNTAKQTEDCGFIDTSKLLNCKTQNDAINYLMQETEHKNLIAGEIMIDPERQQYALLDDIAFVAAVKMSMADAGIQRFVAPLSIYSSDKEDHGVALCLDADKTNNILNVMILEQHAKRDGGDLDFSKEVNMALEHLKEVFSDLGMDINTYQNNIPICREKGVCSVVSSEVCRRLLQADNPLHIAKVGLIKINAEQVQKLHQENFQNFTKDRQKTGAKAVSKNKETGGHCL